MCLMLKCCSVTSKMFHVFICIFIATAFGKAQNLALVSVKEGNLVGIMDKEAGMFFGIPFSQPPVGKFRWRNPRDPLKYQTKYWNATYKRPGCMQMCGNVMKKYTCPVKKSEDCLYLNIWIPHKLLSLTHANDILSQDHYVIKSDYLPGGGRKPLAVMTWLHGGNFIMGSGGDLLYDGRVMANKGEVIVVTTNYRLGPFGFLVQGTNPLESKGNFGILDQVKALEWIRDNVENFGGDPKQITLFGESAGAESIGIYLTSDICPSLFSKGIMQSNPLPLPLRSLDEAKKFGKSLAKAVNCQANDMKCLRSRSAKQVLNGVSQLYNIETSLQSKINFIHFQPWGPVIDGILIKDHPIKLFFEGKALKKPMIVGTVENDGLMFVNMILQESLSSLVYDIALVMLFKNESREVLQKYPLNTLCSTSIINCDNRRTLARLVTDFLFKCPQRKISKSTNESQIWSYVFAQSTSFYNIWEDYTLCYNKSCHGSELAYLFNNKDLKKFNATKDEIQLSKRLLRYWTNFAKYGNPNGPQDPSSSETMPQSNGESIRTIHWPKFDELNTIDGYKTLKFTALEDSVIKNLKKDICDFWDKLDFYSKI